MDRCHQSKFESSPLQTALHGRGAYSPSRHHIYNYRRENESMEAQGCGITTEARSNISRTNSHGALKDKINFWQRQSLLGVPRPMVTGQTHSYLGSNTKLLCKLYVVLQSTKTMHLCYLLNAWHGCYPVMYLGPYVFLDHKWQ